MVRLSSVVVTAALLPLIVQGTPIEVSTNGYSAFCSPNNALAFALNLPDDGSTDLYFSLSAWSNISWAVCTSISRGRLMLTVLGRGHGQ